MNSAIFRSLSYGVYVISSVDGARPTGCTANSLMQITSSPATVAVSINHDNFTNACIKKSGRFTFSVLSEQSEPSIIGRFGFSSGRDTDKFTGIDHQIVDGLPVVSDACAYGICRVLQTMETETHTVFLGEVIDGDTLDKAPAMTYAYYHNVIKGKSPKNAPTYLPEESQAETACSYVCSMCNYHYDGSIPFEELGEDYKCPVCGMPKEKFAKA